jgi:hypothetical protein
MTLETVEIRIFATVTEGTLTSCRGLWHVCKTIWVSSTFLRPAMLPFYLLEAL